VSRAIIRLKLSYHAGRPKPPPPPRAIPAPCARHCKVFPITTFQTLGLSQPVLDALASKNYTTPTPIQAQAIPTVLSGRDLLGIAQTGTGKTAAFMLPSIDRLVASGKKAAPGRCRMLVIAPTRELASQIAENGKFYARGSRLHVATVFGGTSIYKNKQDMAKGADILVCTPGRLVDLIEQRAVNLDATEILVLDEADQMLDLGFIHALKWICQRLPSERQTLFFSATMPASIRDLAGKFIKNPVEVSVTPAATTVQRIEQSVTFVDQSEKGVLLTLTLKREAVERALVFSRTKHGCDKIVRVLAASGVPAVAIHGNKSQPQRERALADFKSGRVKVLIATDIAARGIDVTGVSHVINYDLPNVPEQYVHRIGRTARNGAGGIAISFCSGDERPYMKLIEKLTRQKIDATPLPSDFAAEASRMRALRPAPEPERGRRDEGHRHNQKLNRGRARDADPRRDVIRDNDPRRDMPQREERAPGGAQRRPAHAARPVTAHARPIANPVREGQRAPFGGANPGNGQGGRPPRDGQRPQGQRPAGNGGNRGRGGNGGANGGGGRPSGGQRTAY
jgi:ATP-dependent RNA helicase RhlE